jgi:hypothetical protein
MNKFVKFTDSQGECCYINVDQIRAITVNKEAKRGGSKIILDFGSSMDVLESPERVLCRCRNAGQVSTPETAY